MTGPVAVDDDDPAFPSGTMDARILVVEDDADLRETIGAALAADGHHVEVADDGRTALDALAVGGHDIALGVRGARGAAARTRRGTVACPAARGDLRGRRLPRPPRRRRPRPPPARQARAPWRRSGRRRDGPGVGYRVGG